MNQKEDKGVDLLKLDENGYFINAPDYIKIRLLHEHFEEYREMSLSYRIKKFLKKIFK